jgi:hypothetical protein
MNLSPPTLTDDEVLKQNVNPVKRLLPGMGSNQCCVGVWIQVLDRTGGSGFEYPEADQIQILKAPSKSITSDPPFGYLVWF